MAERAQHPPEAHLSQRGSPQIAGRPADVDGPLERRGGAQRIAQLMLSPAQIGQVMSFGGPESELVDDFGGLLQVGGRVGEPVLGLSESAQHGLGMDPAPVVADGPISRSASSHAAFPGHLAAGDLGPRGQHPVGGSSHQAAVVEHGPALVQQVQSVLGPALLATHEGEVELPSLRNSSSAIAMPGLDVAGRPVELPGRRFSQPASSMAYARSRPAGSAAASPWRIRLARRRRRR